MRSFPHSSRPGWQRALRRINPLLVALGAGVVLSACAVAPLPVYDDGYADAAVYTTVAPPAPYVEPVPVAPFAGAIWIDGFWDWSGGRHVWRPGHYEHPRPGFHYRSPAWSHGGDGRWMLQRGGWRPEGGRPGPGRGPGGPGHFERR
jgi:hypothetical protein